MSDPGNRPHLSRLAAAAWVAKGLATLLVAVLMLRWLYTTDAGIRMMNHVSDAVWRKYHALLGFRDESAVERTQNVDALLVLSACVATAAGIVATGSVLWSGARARRAGRG